jgi:hypothetical protein
VVLVWGLTFELTGALRQDALARLARMYRVPPTGPRWPAVARPVERGVRPHSLRSYWRRLALHRWPTVKGQVELLQLLRQ